MSRRLLLAAACTLAVAATAQAQQIKTYVQSQTGPQFLTYGLPVPLPIASLTPVDGFRTYDSVQARLQALAMQSPDLSAHDVGRSLANRTVWAYVASDEGDVDVEGRPEAAFFINASTHAREWATPEVSTGTVERLMAGAGDGGIVRYVLDNTKLVIVPAQNVDGILQTQRYPTQVLVGADPEVPDEFPRDGRMRRKNMRNVDEVLTTTGDHLFGVDLNRNHPPFWATEPTRSSPNPVSIVHHGAAPHSEPENQAILSAARLGPETRFRLGIDLHTFSRVFFSSNTQRVRLNAVQRDLISVMAGHHQALSGALYDDVPDPGNRGIGAAAEYFAYEWLVPAWTLEIEPRNGAQDYGGTNVTHGGFILPASEARRVRESWAETHLVAFYRMAGPAHLARVRYVDVQTGAVASQVRWQWNAQTARRDRVVDVAGSLLASRRYRVELGFSKPMRQRNAAGQVAGLPGGVAQPAPSVALVQGATRTPLDTTGGAWIDDPARVLRYRDDTFAFEFVASAAAGESTLEVSAIDLTGMSLDADPSSGADWSQGAWSEYENVAGIDGDVGGADRSTTFAVATAPASQASVLTTNAIAGEGDAATLRVTRAAGSAGRLEIRTPEGVTLATWAAGEAGERTLLAPIPDNTQVDGDRVANVALVEAIDGVAGVPLAASVRVLDNDDATRAVWRVNAGGSLAAGWNALASQPRGELVLSGNTTHVAPLSAPSVFALAQVSRELIVHGNAADIVEEAQHPSRRLWNVAVGGKLTLDRVDVALTSNATEDSGGAVLMNAGEARLRRSQLVMDTAGIPLVRNTGVLAIERSGLRSAVTRQRPSIEQLAGSLAIDGSSLASVTAAGSENASLLGIDGGTAIARNSTLAGYRIVTDTSPVALQVQASIVQEAGDRVATPPAGRGPCTRPVMSGLGGNVFTTDYAVGSESQFRDSGCFTMAGTDVFDPAARVQLEAGADARVIFPLPADYSRADRVGEAQCAPVDQRGATRPQSLTGGIVPPRCESGAYEIGINPYRGIWSPQRSGHGVDIQTLGNRLFLAWYTYESDGEPTAYQASGLFTGPVWEATLEQSSRNPQTGVVSVRSVGRVTITFHDDTHATFAWQFQDQPAGQEEITASLFASGEPRVEVTGLWYPPADSGYGATISRRGEVTAVGVYYYDAQGNVRWALGTGTGADAQELAMTSFRGFCPDCSPVQNPVTGTPAGTLLAHFHTPVQARLDMQLTYPGAAGGQWNRNNARFVPLNDPVDNRDALRPD